jgi:hypothetical protein
MRARGIAFMKKSRPAPTVRDSTAGRRQRAKDQMGFDEKGTRESDETAAI